MIPRDTPRAQRGPGPIILAAVVLVAFVARAAFVLLQNRLALFDAPFVASDSALYLKLAHSIVDGRGFAIDGRPTAYVGPGYPSMLAVLVAIGADTVAIGLTQSVLGALSAGLAAIFAFELTVERRPDSAARIGIVAGLLVAVYPHLVFWTGYVLTETLFVFLVACAMTLLLLGWSRRRTYLAVAAGVLFGLAGLTRAPALGIAIGLCVWLAAAAVRRHRSPVLALGLLVGVAVPTGLWALRNVVAVGYPVMTTTESGYVFYQGNSRGANGGSRGYVDALDFAPLAVPANLDEVQVDALYFRTAVADVVADPIGTIARWPAKLWNMWRPTYEGASVRNLAITSVTYVPVLLLGVIGAVMAARGGQTGARLLPVLFLIGWTALHVLVTGMIRFRLPAEWMLCIAAAIPIVLAMERMIRVRGAT